ADAISRAPSLQPTAAIRDCVGAISVGIVHGQAVLDLNYVEDSSAEVDMNVVMTGAGEFVEVQGTAEQVPFGRARLDALPALGDDTGLEVDALGGAPGLYTARFGGPGLDDRRRLEHLLERLRGVPPARRTARFRCVIALVGPAHAEKVVEGVAEGRIAEAPRGNGGFGYDPLFFYPPLARTFAELSDEDKARVSHRGRALETVRRLLRG